LTDFQSIGTQLKQAREAKELTLPDVEKQTRIRLKFLQAIEYGQFFIIDNPTQLRGFLRKYARTVGLDELAVLSAYEDALRGERKRSRRPRRKPDKASSATTTPPPATGPQPMRVERLPVDTARYANRLPETYQGGNSSRLRMVVLVILVAGFLGLIIGGVALVIGEVGDADSDAPPEGLIQSVNIGGSPSVQPIVSPTPPEQPTLAGTPVLNPGQPFTVELTAQVRLWLRVEVDGAIPFEGLFRPGDGVSYQPGDYITIRTTNAGGLVVRVNEQPLSLGQGRQPITRTISVQDGILPPEGQSSIPRSLPATSVSADNPPQTATPSLVSASNTPAVPTITPTPTSSPTPAGPPTSTSIPIFDFASDTPTYTASPVPPSATPTFTASPFLPTRLTSTPTPEKDN
jgi:cytoskeleton protein RodZ